MSARYPCATIDDMAAIPAEAIPRFLAELPHMLAEMAAIQAFAAQNGATVGFDQAVWTDDNQHFGNVTLTTPAGEIKYRRDFDGPAA